MLDKVKVDKIKADFILLHAPAIYDFRNRDDIALGWYGSQESSNVTPIFEIYPLGFLSLKSHLMQQGFTVEIVNVASLMLRHREMKVEKLLEHLEAPIFGIDLHWLPHCHGAIELAGVVKKVRPDALVMLGGIVSTYYNKELMAYPQVDIVARGYDTLEPVRMLVQAVSEGKRQEGFSHIPNLVYKQDGEIVDTGFTHRPEVLNDVAIDWSKMFGEKFNLMNLPSMFVLPNTGCAMKCGWCSGSNYGYKRIMQAGKKTVFHRNMDQIKKEINTVPKLDVPLSIYSLQMYSESGKKILEYLEGVQHSGKAKSVSMEQYRLPKPELMQEMRRVAPDIDIMFNLSPQSHDVEISRLSGRGTYTNEQMEDWLDAAFDIGIKGVYIWYTIGMPKQTHASVMETVEYTARLMEKFEDKLVVPSIFGMIPFLDPGCQWFEEEGGNSYGEHGYKVFFKDLERHRQSMVQTNWIDAMNYETKWMPREEFLWSMYEAVRKMADYKYDFGRVTKKSIKIIHDRMDRIANIMRTIQDIYEKDGTKELPQWLKDEIVLHNEDVLSYAADVRLAKKPLVGRWYDDHAVPLNIVEACS